MTSVSASKPFDRKTVKTGDLLVLAADESVRVRFKFDTSWGDVVCTWVKRPPGRPADLITRPRQLRVPLEPG